jgi:hypothetical protein
MAPFYAFSWFGVSIWGMRYCYSASGIFRVSLALKGLPTIAWGKRGATLGRVDKTDPILTLKGLHKIRISPSAPFFSPAEQPDRTSILVI